MSLFRNILGALVELDEQPKTAPALHLTTGPLAPTHLPTAPTASPVAISRADADKFSSHFEQLFEASNLPGPDYFEFFKAVEALETALPDETGRMRAAFTTLQVQGLTKQTLADTARQYAVIVEGDRKQFEDALKAKIRTEIEPLEQAAIAASNAEAEDTRRIAEIQAGLEAKRRAADEAARRVEEARARLTANTAGYTAACQAMVARINEDIDKIKTLL
jgi:hypothetical protein